jgi:hypothetical protein
MTIENNLTRAEFKNDLSSFLKSKYKEISHFLIDDIYFWLSKREDVVYFPDFCSDNDKINCDEDCINCIGLKGE